MSYEDFSFGYWLNGWRKNRGDASPDILCLESGCYGLMLDVAALRNVRFGLLDDDVDYVQALASGASRDVSRLKDVKLWESGRLVQHFELFDVLFEDAAGRPLGCLGSLGLVAWTDSFALTAELTPDVVHKLYRDVDGQLEPLDRSVQGNDFWQTDYDTCNETYRLTFNLPLDGIEACSGGEA